MNNNFTLISNNKCWMESTALSQLSAVASLSGVTQAVGLPDLHAGKSPVGIAVEAQGILYPHLIGNDIGCGMSLFETHCPLRKYKQERFVQRLNNIRALEDIPVHNPYPEDCPISDFGTLGGGNHFAEFQAVEKIYDAVAFQRLDIDKDQVLLLVHSGSRSYGDRILDEFLDLGGLSRESMQTYLAAHDDALLWAQRNRLTVARKLAEYLGCATGLKKLIDCHHNFVERSGDRYIHRKGAVSTLAGAVVVPGSRGSLTYIVEPAEPTEKTDASLFSLSHGAGRKWIRSLCKGRLKDKYHRDTIHETRLGSKTVCHDTDVLYEEAPEAYKGIENVIDALVQHGLCEVVATLRPLLTFKA